MIRKSCYTLRVLLLMAAFLIPAAKADTLHDLSFSDAQGNSVSLSQYRGKAVMLNFWATWCPPCLKEMPSMQRLKAELAGEAFEIVAVNAGETAEAIEIFMMELDEPLNFPVLLDPTGSTFRDLNIRGLPMTFLFDADGKLLHSIAGGREWDSRDSVRLVRSILPKLP